MKFDILGWRAGRRRKSRAGGASAIRHLALAGAVGALSVIGANAAIAPGENRFTEESAVIDSLSPGTFVKNRYVMHLDPVLVAKAMKGESIHGVADEDLAKFSFVIAHRGQHTEPGFAENGLTAIQRAYDAGADGIELDIKVSSDGVAVLGHDVTLGREARDPGAGGAFNPFDALRFPLNALNYFKNTNWPFMVNKESNGTPDNGNRSKLDWSSFQNYQLTDQFNNTLPASSDKQLSLYQALYYMASRDTPMMVWLDIKDVSGLEAAIIDLEQARADFQTGNSFLDTVGLKITQKTLETYRENHKDDPDPRLSSKGLVYFNVGGADMVGALSATPDMAAITSTFCKKGAEYDGCIGIELNHKYQGAPTQEIFNALNGAFATSDVRLAGFHTLPQYYWNALEYQAGGYGKYDMGLAERWFPRTDGSCCFALTDALNSTRVSNASAEKNTVSEETDYRASWSWIGQFNVITTDDPANMIRQLRAQSGYHGPRGSNVADVLAAPFVNDDYDLQGGAQSLAGPDGLYFIYDHSGTLRPGADPNSSPPTHPAPLNLREDIHALVALDETDIVLIKADGAEALGTSNGAVAYFPVHSVPHGQSDKATWRIETHREENGFKIVSITTKAPDGGQQYLAVSLNGYYLTSQPAEVRLIPVNPPLVEKQDFHEHGVNGLMTADRAPPGAHYQCPENGACDPGVATYHHRRVFYGAGETWKYKDLFAAQPGSRRWVDCTNAAMTDPLQGVKKRCYTTPILFDTVFPREFTTVWAAPYSDPIPVKRRAAFYFRTAHDYLGRWRGEYIRQDQLTDNRCRPVGTEDPSWDDQKACYPMRVSPDPDITAFPHTHFHTTAAASVLETVHEALDPDSWVYYGARRFPTENFIEPGSTIGVVDGTPDYQGINNWSGVYLRVKEMVGAVYMPDGSFVTQFTCRLPPGVPDPTRGIEKSCYLAKSNRPNAGRILDGFPETFSKYKMWSVGEQMPAMPPSTPIYYGIYRTSGGVDTSLGFITHYSTMGGTCHRPDGFPDPIYGVVKYCYAAKPVAPVNGGYVPCHEEGCKFSVPHDVALFARGAAGRWAATYKRISAGVACDPKSFGYDPLGEESVDYRCFARRETGGTSYAPDHNTNSNIVPRSELRRSVVCAMNGEFCRAGEGARYVFVYVEEMTQKRHYLQERLAGDLLCKPSTFGLDSLGEGNSGDRCEYMLY